MVAEKVLQKVLEDYPELIESGLVLVSREAALGDGRDRRMDLLFSDSLGRRLLVELKRGIVQDKDVGQLLRYSGELLLKTGRSTPLRKMLIGTRMGENLRAGLESCGIEWKELDLHEVNKFLLQRGMKAIMVESDLQPIDTGGPTMPLRRSKKAIRVRLRNQTIGPASPPIVMIKLYKLLISTFAIEPHELIPCSNVARKQRFEVIQQKIETKEAFSCIATANLCELGRFEIFSVGETTCGITTMWGRGAAERVIKKMGTKFPGLQITLDPGV